MRVAVVSPWTALHTLKGPHLRNLRTLRTDRSRRLDERPVANAYTRTVSRRPSADFTVFADSVGWGILNTSVRERVRDRGCPLWIFNVAHTKVMVVRPRSPGLAPVE